MLPSERLFGPADILKGWHTLWQVVVWSAVVLWAAVFMFDFIWCWELGKFFARRLFRRRIRASIWRVRSRTSPALRSRTTESFVEGSWSESDSEREPNLRLILKILKDGLTKRMRNIKNIRSFYYRCRVLWNWAERDVPKTSRYRAEFSLVWARFSFGMAQHESRRNIFVIIMESCSVSTHFQRLSYNIF